MPFGLLARRVLNCPVRQFTMASAVSLHLAYLLEIVNLTNSVLEV